jgi:hypothetical protein
MCFPLQRTSAFLSLVIAMTASTAVAALENENILVTVPDGYKNLVQGDAGQ